MDLIQLHEPFEEPEESYGLLQAMLERTAASGRGAALIFPSSRHIGVTRPDTRNPDFGEAVAVAEGLGFQVLMRRSGGGVVAADPGTLTLAVYEPVADLRHGIYERYGAATDLVVAALERVGVRSEAGEVAAEFCPGAYSVRSGGYNGMKLAGLSQRVTRRAARLDALVMAEPAPELSDALESFYGALKTPFRRGSVGSLAAAGSTGGVKELADALEEEARERYGASESVLTDEVRRAARSLIGEYRIREVG